MGKVIDCTGQTFGFLTVIQKAGIVKHQMMWLCKCKCGNECVVPGSSLRNGNTQSCGCKRAVSYREHQENLIGKRFDKLLVIDRIYVENNKMKWKCVCDCGNIRYASTHDLTTGDVHSCGCITSELLSLSKRKGRAGERHNNLTAIRFIGIKNHRSIWLWKCDCGKETEAELSAVRYGRIKTCGCIKSYPEEIIASFLDANNIEYTRQKAFPGCCYIKDLLFDFYIPGHGVIEYDGEFHYQYIDGINNDLEAQQLRDNIKTEYCTQHNIPLLRIPYWEKDNIESILSDWLFLNDGADANSVTCDLSA